MEGDSEGLYIREINKLNDIQKQVKSLERKLDKLLNRVGTLEMMALQDQIIQLDSKCNDVRNKLESTTKSLAITQIEDTATHLFTLIRDEIDDISLKKRLREELLIKYVSICGQVKQSDDPLKLSLDFRHECTSISEKYNLKGFTANLGIWS